MSDAHEHHHHDHPAPPPETPVDTGSQALEEALRSSFVIVKAVLVVMVIVFIFSGVRSIGPQERAIVLRFGKPVGVGAEQLLMPGFHWAWPYPIDEIVPIKVGEIQTITSSVGWYSQTPEQELAGAEPPELPSLNPSSEGYALTGDANIVHVRATMRYRINDPLAYEFNFQNAPDVVTNVLNNAVVYAAAHSTVDYALLNSAGFTEKVVAQVSRQIAERKLGIRLEPVDVRVVPPKFVKSAFDEVLSAEQDRSKAISEAQGAAATTNTLAQSQATNLVNVAEAGRIGSVRTIAAEAKSFSDQLPQYRANPELFQQRLLTETWQRILSNPNIEKWFKDSPAGGKPYELRLLLNREPQAPKPGQSSQP